MTGSTAENSVPAQRSVSQPNRWWALAFLLGAAILIIWSVGSSWPEPIESLDINQHRINAFVPAPQGSDQVRQTFIPEHDGLSEIELVLLRHENEPGFGDSSSQITFTLMDGDGTVVVQRALGANQAVHNQTYALSFPAQKASAGQQYTLLIEGDQNNPVSAWGYDLDVYADGALEVNQEAVRAADLRFITRYQLSFWAGLASAFKILWTNLILIGLSLLFLLLPGSLLLIAGRRWISKMPAAVYLGLAVGLGASTWPIIWLWTTELGIRWRAWSLWTLFVTGWLVVLAWFFLKRFKQVQREGQLQVPELEGQGSRYKKPGLSSRQEVRGVLRSWPTALFLVVFSIGLLVRLAAVRDLEFPPWVDSSRHALITTLMADSGQSITDYRPLLPVDRAPYHYGFHSVSTSLSLMTGEPLPNLLLILGQTLNALVPLTLYAATYLLTRRKLAALTAAFLVALPFLFPGYYATWGRMTQLMGVIVLPIAMAIGWTVIRGSRGARKQWIFLSMLSAGLFLVHIRVFLLFLPFVFLTWLFSRFRHWRWLLSAAVLALLLVASRIITLVNSYSFNQLANSASGYNDFPIGYVTTGWEKPLLWLGAAALILSIGACLRRRRWALLPLILAAWVGVVALLLSSRNFGFPETWVINVNSAYIVLFIPLAILLAVVGERIWEWLGDRHWTIQISRWAAAGILVSGALLFGLTQQISILNPDTILAEAPDAQGLDWLANHSQPDSIIAVNSWKWLGNVWAGSDGGAWIGPVTGEMSTTPPVDYFYDPELRDRVTGFNETAAEVENWSGLKSVEWLRDQGVDLIFVGAKGGFLDPSQLSKNPGLKLEYERDGVFIFAVRPAE